MWSPTKTRHRWRRREIGETNRIDRELSGNCRRNTRAYAPSISRDIRKGEEIMTTRSITDTIKEATGMSIGMAVLMIVLGFLAVFLPFATGIGISILVGWIIVF